MEDATPHMVYTACALTVRDRIMEKVGRISSDCKRRWVQKNFIIYHLSSLWADFFAQTF